MDNTPSAFEKINFVRGFDDGSITTSEKFVLFIITTHLGDNDFAFLSLTTLMRECCQSRGVISKNIQKLVNKGYLIKINPSDGYKSCRFAVDFDVLDNCERLLVPERYQETSTESVLVRKAYHTSTESVPDQYGKRTSLVRKAYPNRKINAFEKKDKRKRVPRPLTSSPKNQEQKLDQELEKCSGCQRPAKYCSCSSLKSEWKPETRAMWDQAMAKLKGKTNGV